MAFTYAFALDTMMSVSDPRPVNTLPSSAATRTVTSPIASMPRVMALMENSERSPWTATTWSIAW